MALVRDSDAGVVRFYVDGELLGDPVPFLKLPEYLPITEQEVSFGGDIYPGYSLDGHVDEPRLAARVRSQSELRAESLLALDSEAIVIAEEVREGRTGNGSLPTWGDDTLSLVTRGRTLLVIAWTPDAIVGDEPVRFEVFVDGVLAAQVPVSVSEAALEGLEPSTAYQVRVEALGATGRRTSDGPHASLSTLAVPPPVEEQATSLRAAETPPFFDVVRFLVEGDEPAVDGFDAASFDETRTAVVRGDVVDEAGVSLRGVSVDATHDTALGRTVTRADGTWDLVVEGGGLVSLSFAKAGYVPVSRQLEVPIEDFLRAPTVVMTARDTAATQVALPAIAPVLHAASVVSDGDGTRQAAVFFPSGVGAALVLDDGGLLSVTSLTIRATEVTVGEHGEEAMPGPLPPTSGYTYAAELSADEAAAVGARSVVFTRPVPFYVDNFLGLPVGLAVPAATFVPGEDAWEPMPDGRVIAIVGVTADLADLDIDGDAAADGDGALLAIGITQEERRALASHRGAGASLWRVELAHFSSIDLNWPNIGPADAVSPPLPSAAQLVRQQPTRPTGAKGMGTIDYEAQVFHEEIAIAGTSFSLHYASDAVPGRRRERTLEIPLVAGVPPASLLGVDLIITIAGRRFRTSFTPSADLTVPFTWDGLDAYGRPVMGTRNAQVAVQYRYPGFIALPAGATSSFGLTSGVATTLPSRVDWRLTSIQLVPLSSWDARGDELGGFTLDVMHRFDPKGWRGALRPRQPALARWRLHRVGRHHPRRPLRQWERLHG